MNAALLEVDQAVVGGGAAALAMLLAWQGEGRHAGRIAWIAPQGSDGSGIAYATTHPVHLLNVPAARMGLCAERPGDFVDFLRARDGDADPFRCYPRRDYADYLRDRLRRLGRSCQRIDGMAAALRLIDSRVELHLDDGRRVIAGRVVLALGSGAPSLLGGVDPALLDDGRYLLDPWKGLACGLSRGPGERVWVVGSGLTAVDVVLALNEQDPRVRLDLLSRHGGLPAAHADLAGAGKVDWSGWVRSLGKPKAVSALLRALRGQLAGRDDWQEAFDALRAVVPGIWMALPAAERARFLRHLRWAWDRCRHRMAPEVAERIAELRSSGRLRVHAGRLLRVDQNGGQGVRVLWRGRGAGAPESVAAERVFQACGLEYCARRSQLLDDLLREGLAQRDPLGLGLRCDSELRLIDAKGCAHSELRILGAMARGTVWECTAMPEIRSHAARIAADPLPEQPGQHVA